MPIWPIKYTSDMLKLSSTLENVQVMSLRTGEPVGLATHMIINPNNLKIEGWHVQDRFDGRKLILVNTDVRDFSDKGIIINDHEVLSEVEELVRLKTVLRINFKLLGKQVVSQSGGKYGKITDFAVETGSMFVKKLYASQSIFKSFTGGNVSIDRTQIIEITKDKIIIEDATEKAGAAVATEPVNS